MIIALFALAVLMIVGGVASVVQGFPFVRLESGMAMTVAGATTASAGAVVLGLAAVAGHLRGLGQRLAALRPEAPPAENRTTALPSREAEPDLSEPASTLSTSTLSTSTLPIATLPARDDRPVRQRPNLGGPDAREFGLGAMGAAAGLGAAGFGTGSSGTVSHADPRGRGAEPTFVLPPDPDLPAPPPPAEIEPPLPDLLPPEEETRTLPDARPEPRPAEPEPEPVAAASPASENQPTLALFDAEAPGEPVRLYSSLDTMADIAPEPPPPPAVEEKPEIVGTYASGGNTYVMYANGSIEAETPRGRFSFESLDELKAFVEAGGENDARGAA